MLATLLSLPLLFQLNLDYELLAVEDARAEATALVEALADDDTATKLRNISFAPLPPDPEAAGLTPLSKLPQEVDRRFAQAQD